MDIKELAEYLSETRVYKEEIEDLIIEYAKEKCKSQRRICAGRGSIGNSEFIEKAPEPKFD